MMRLNWSVQLVCIGVTAFLIWWAVFSLAYQTFRLDIPINTVNLKEDLAVGNSLTTTQIVIRAQRFLTFKINKNNSNIKALLDLKDIDSFGVHKVSLQILLDVKGVNLVSYHPEVLDISIVPKEQIQIDLVSDVINFPASGFSLGEVKITPSVVTVFGPSNLLTDGMKAFVSIDVKNKKKSFSVFGQPEIRNALNNKLMNFVFNPSSVMVTAEIKSGDSLKTLGLQPVFTGELKPGYWISTIIFDPPALTIRGDASKLAEMEYLLTSPINIADKSESFTDKASAELPSGITLLDHNLISVKINLKTSSNNRQLILLPSYTNITKGLSVTALSPPTVTVVLSGLPDKLAELDRLNTLLDLDLRGSLSGRNQIELNMQMFTVPEGVEVVSFSPNVLEVTLTKNN